VTARERLEELLGPNLAGTISELVGELVAAAVEQQTGAPDASPWLSVPEAAGYLRASERTVQRLVARGRIRSTSVGRRRLLHRDELDAYMQSTEGGL
jgi:excisionase family DNA binding protein